MSIKIRDKRTPIPIKPTPNIGVLLISRDRNLDLIRERLREIDEQCFKPSRIIVCVERPEFVQESMNILKKYEEEKKVPINVVQLYAFDERDLEIVDECYRYNVGYMMVFESNFKIPNTAFRDLNKALQSGNGVVYMAPYKGYELSGMVIFCPVFKQLYGNKPIVHPDGTIDRRTYAERVKELISIEGNTNEL